MPPTMQALWDRLSPEHRAILTQLIESLAAVDTPTLPVQPADDLGKLFASWESEDASLTPEQVAEAEAEWRDIQDALNRNRAPEPPLFP